MAGNNVQKSKPSHVSEAAPPFYKPGNLKAVASWNYVAYLYLRKVHLRSYVGSPRVEVGTVDFVTNNPGSLDYDPTSSLPALTEAGKHGAYPKTAEILSGPYRRFAVFPNEQIGIDAVIPALASADCASKLDLFVSEGVLYRGHPRSSIAAERLGVIDTMNDSINVHEDPLAPGIFIFSEFPIVLATSHAGSLEKARVVLGTEGGFVTDDKGYYEFFGPVTDAFRASATCGPDLPIELCSDRFEAPGLLEKFLHGDFTYRRR
jgi:hypothetical protein